MELNSSHSMETNYELDILPAVGEYHVLSLEPSNTIAISTLKTQN